MKLETASAARPAQVFRDRQDPRVSLVSVGTRDRKGNQETQACMVSQGSRDSREPRAPLEFLDPRE